MTAKTLSGVFFTRILAVLLIVCLAECAAGSCLSYGHSCWGGHGKRSSARASQEMGAANVNSENLPLLVSKMIRQNLLRRNFIPYPMSENLLRNQRMMRNPFESLEERNRAPQVKQRSLMDEDESVQELKQESDLIYDV